jgi:tetratricopeptide (TPR) repeat protein
MSRKIFSFVFAATICGIFATSAIAPDPVLARQKFDKATAEPSEANLKQGLDLIKQSNYEAAIDSFQQAIYFSRNHYNPEAYKLIGICYKALRQYGKAMDSFRTQLNQSTVPEPDVRIDLAECLIEVGETDKAREELNRAYNDAGNKGTFRQKFAMGEMHEKLKDYSQALDFYASALEEKPSYTDAAMGIGRMNVLLKQYNRALVAYRNILDKGPLFQHVNYEELYYNMGNCFINRGDHQGALDHWRMALESNPESFDAHLALARMLDDEKHYSSASKEYEAALRNLPKSGAMGMKDQIMRRLQYIDAKTAPKEAAPVIKPSPQMRQEYEDSVHQRTKIMNTTPPTKDSGF